MPTSFSRAQMLGRPLGDSLARFGSGMLPVGYESREAFEILRRANEWHPCQGLKLQFVNPVNVMFGFSWGQSEAIL
jgi:gentisate 1,2-dioxygenase